MREKEVSVYPMWNPNPQSKIKSKWHPQYNNPEESSDLFGKTETHFDVIQAEHWFSSTNLL